MGSNTDTVADIFEMARDMFLEDGAHAPMYFVLREGEVLGVGEVAGQDQDERRESMMGIAEQVARDDAEAILVISEARSSPPDTRPATDAARKEILTGMFASRVEDDLHLHAEILRSGDSVTLGPTVTEPGLLAYVLEPVYAVWGRTVDEPPTLN
jgi:hypothetical protein